MADPLDIYEKKRLELQSLLENVLGSRNVYFQPPANVRMKYPAIVYTRTGIETIRASNGIHRMMPVYEVVLIDPNPDSVLVFKLLQLPLCSHTRHYEQENLNHDVFRLYY